MEQLDFCIREDRNKYLPVTVDSIYYVLADGSYHIRHGKIPGSHVLIATLSGAGTLLTGDGRFELQAEDVLIFDASRENFSYFCREDAWNFWWFEFILYDPAFLDLPVHRVFSHPLKENELNLCSEALFSLKLKNSKTASSLLAALICLLQKQATGSSTSLNGFEILRKADEYIRRHLDTVTVQATAEYLGISERTLLNVFRSKLNVSTVSYISHIKTDMARHLLLTTDLSIKKIAETLGYNDPFTFSYVFKQRFGRSPRQYREYWEAQGEN